MSSRTPDRVNVIKHVRVDGHWRYAAVVEQGGRIIPDVVWVRGAPERHPEGKYVLDWYEGRCRRRRSIGGLEKTCEAARAKLIERNAPLVAGGRLTIGLAMERYLTRTELHRSRTTFLCYRSILTRFRQSCRKSYVDQIQRENILDFMSHSYGRGLTKVTIYNQLTVVLQWLKAFGIVKLMAPTDWPVAVATIRPTYEAYELDAMLRCAKSDDQMLLQFLLASGFRNREMQHLIWHDIDWHNSVVRVTAKRFWRFAPKNGEERVVPLPSALTHRLQRLWERRRVPYSHLVFPTSLGNRDRNIGNIVKRIADCAGLNCGHCITKSGNRCSEGPHCKRFFVHKFRHTFATEHLRHGIDICTLQRWLGHRNIQSTMVYLRGLEPKEALAKVNTGFLVPYMSLQPQTDDS
jgi:integrase/recombinase XerD